MEQYIKDLVNYLKDSFDISSNIDFEFDIEKILLDETKSIPLGLILNESITNCIKYAFPNNKKGTVFIFMKTLKNGLYCLSVKDDGIGFPDKFDINKTSSLGFSLIKGLCKQLDGEVQVKNDKGVLVEVRFK